MKGDIVLVPFPFTDLTGNKLRPAVILVESRDDVIVAFITSQGKRDDDYSIKLDVSETNGLKVNSHLRLNKITTLDKDLIEGKLGVLMLPEIALLDKILLKMLDLRFLDKDGS